MMIKVENLSFSYKKGNSILEDINFQIDRGDIICILGPNGIGKSTLLKCLLSILKKDKGNIIIEGKNIEDLSVKEKAKFIAYVPQFSDVGFSLTVEEVILMGRINHLRFATSPKKEDYEEMEKAIKLLSIEKLRNKYFDKLSGGEKQMVLIARALVQKSKYILMDEPTSNLDYGNQSKILKVINKLGENGYGVLLTSHYPEHSFILKSKVIVMSQGNIIHNGEAIDIVTTEILSELYKTNIEIVDTEKLLDGTVARVCVMK